MFGKLKVAIKIILYVKNWPSVILGSIILKRGATARFRSGFSIKVNTQTFGMFVHNLDFFRYFPDGKIEGTRATINYKGKTLVFNCGNFEPISLCEVFGWGSYEVFLKGIDLSNRVVVDIGASFGDTPVYFATLGAKKVVGIEPVLSCVGLARENISLNQLDSVCDIIHAGVGRTILADISFDPFFKVVIGAYSSIKSEFDFTHDVPVITIESIVEKYNISDGVLKIDCEGWEYDILENTKDEFLRRFEFFIAEYHYGFENLERRLNAAGFAVSYTKPTHVYVPERQGEYKDMYVGMLFAKRVNK
ncbi:MAG: FkbM family methyltransferase [bacterium]|nr:FkbM family methyltransferase [bacterium]